MPATVPGPGRHDGPRDPPAPWYTPRLARIAGASEDPELRYPSRLRARHDGAAYELRAPEPRHAAALVEAVNASLPELRAFMPWAHHPQTVDGQYDRLVTTQADFWAGRDAVYHLFGPLGDEPEAFLGCYGLHRRTLNPRGIELGFWTRTQVAGRGLATLASRMLVVTCFSHLGLERVQCLHNASNHGSRRVQQKVGFREEGRLEHFAGQPTEAMVAAGAVVDPVTVINALVQRDVPDLAWYPALARQLELWDWEGRPGPLVRVEG